MPARMERLWSPKETTSLISFDDCGTSSTAMIVPTRMSSESRVEKGTAGLTGAGFIFYSTYEGRRLSNDAHRQTTDSIKADTLTVTRPAIRRSWRLSFHDSVRCRNYIAKRFRRDSQ